MRKVFISGFFEIIHPGHIRLLEFAKEHGDHLTVGLVIDHSCSINKYGFSHDDKRLNLLSLEMVDQVLVIESVTTEILIDCGPSIIVKGREFDGSYNIEQEYADLSGCQILFDSGPPYRHRHSFGRTSPGASEKIIQDFAKRYEIDAMALNSLVRSIVSLNVLVIGDLILDEFIECEALGMSREDHSIVMRPLEGREYVGGAGIIAAHCASLGARVCFTSVIGDDDAGSKAIGELSEDLSIDCSGIVRERSRVTTCKTRYKIGGKTMARVTRVKETEAQNFSIKRIVKFIEERIEGFQLVLIADFNYGVLTQDLVNYLQDLHLKHPNIVFVADCQSSSQTGDVSKYKNVNLITPTEWEARIAVSDNSIGLPILLRRLSSVTKAESIILTLGKDGVLVYDSEEDSLDALPSINARPLDISGAGDSLMCVSGMALALGADIRTAVLLGSMAAALQTSVDGNQPLDPFDIHGMIEESLGVGQS